MFGASKPKFDANKTKVNLKMLINRFNLLTQKKANLAKQQKRQIALLLKDDKEANARILVEHIIREDYTLESYDLLRQYTELLLARLNVLIQEPELKPEVAEAVCALLYAGWLMGSEVPELHVLYQLFTAKYGKVYSEEVVNSKEKYLSHRLLRMLTSTQVPDPSVVELYLTEIAKAYNVDWAPRPSNTPGIPGPLSSTIGMPLPLPGMPVYQPAHQPAHAALEGAAFPHGAPGGGMGVAGAQFVPGPTPGPPPDGAVWGTSVPVAAAAGGGPPATVNVAATVTMLKTPLGFGMQLDGDNVVVTVKADSQASRSGQLQPGDQVVALNGVAVSRDRPVKSLAIEIADGDSATFSIVRGGGGGGVPGPPSLPTFAPAPPPPASSHHDPYGLPAAQPQLQPHLDPPAGYYPAQATPQPSFHAVPQMPQMPAAAYVAADATAYATPAAPAAPAESEDDVLARRLEMLKRG